MRTLAFAFSVAVVAATFAAVACSSSSSASCASFSKCTGAETTVAECNEAVDKCGAAAAAFFGCYAANEVCTSTGAIDEQATETAALASCTIPAGLLTCVGALSAIDGGSTTVTVTSNDCGFAGAACCTEGGTACDDGCCDPSTKHCVSIGGACAGGSTSCVQADTGATGTCTACGAPGEPCCLGDSCATGCCDDEANPAVCVAPGGMCAGLGADSEVCPEAGGFCTLCGDVDSPCCLGATCPSSSTGFTLVCGATNTCEECGGLDDTCCPGDTCSETDTVCSAGTCTLCGISGEPCCADDFCTGSTCTAGTCM